MFWVSKWLIQLVFWKVSPCTTKKFKQQQTKLYHQISELREKFHFVCPIPFLVRGFLVPFCYNVHKPLKLPYSSKFQIGSVPWGAHRWDREGLGEDWGFKAEDHPKEWDPWRVSSLTLKGLLRELGSRLFLHWYEQISRGTTLISIFAF